MDRIRASGVDGAVRISSREWQGDRWFLGVPIALLAHGVAVVALGVVVGRQHGTRVERAPRVTLPERVEDLRFVAPPVSATVPRRHTTLSSLPETPAPERDTAAAIASSPGAVPSPPAVVPSAAAPAASLLASPLLPDRRLVVGPVAAGGVADVRVRDANASIAMRVRAVQDSVRRHDLGWTVGDSTHRFGLAWGCIAVDKICIPFGLASMPNPAAVPAYSGVDRNREDDAAFAAAVARARAMNSKP